MADDPPPRERRLTTAAGVILMAVGLIQGVVGLALLAASVGTVLSGPFVATTALVGLPVAVSSVIVFVGGVHARRGSHFYGVLAAAVLGMVTLLPVTVDLVTAFLIYRVVGQPTVIGTASVLLLGTVEQFFGIGVVSAALLGGLTFFGLPLLDVVAIVLVILGGEAFATGP